MPPHTRPKACHTCGRRAQDGHRISFRGLCRDCALAAHFQAVDEMRTKTGPTWQRYTEARTAALRRELDKLEG